MAIDNNVVTLADYAKQSNAPQVSRIANSLYSFGSVMADWPILTEATLEARGVRAKNVGLPTVGWRKINEATTVTKGVLDPFSEQAFILSNAIDTDVKILLDKNQIGGPGRVIGQQIDLWLEAAAYDVNDKYFNNNHLTGDADAPVGLKARLDDPTSWGASAACKIDAGAPDLSDANITAATINKFLQKLDKMLDEMGEPDGNGVVIYANRDMRRRIAAGIRLLGAGGGFDMTTDAFDRRVMTYRNAMIRTIGVKADGTTEIVTSTETSAGAAGSDSHTSIYAVKYGESGVQPWQMNELGFQDIGVRTDEPTHYRVFIDWAVGYMQFHNRAISRLYGIKVA